MFNFNSSKRHRETPTSPTSRSAFSQTMNPLSNPNLLKLSAFIFISFVFFYLGKHWSDGYQQLVFFSTSPSSRNADVSFSSNSNKSYHISSLIPQNETQSPSQFHIVPSPSSDSIQKFGIITENGTMSDEFEIGEYDTDLVETEWGNDNGTEKTDSGRGRAMIKRFSMCSDDTREIIPCLDNSEAIKRLKSTDKGEKFERHCPQNGTGLNCLVPPPEGYKQPIPWPKSRDEVWYNNVPHTKLVEDKGGQNWISREKDKFKFPGGGTQFIHGADQYLNQFSQMVPNITWGNRTRVVMDIGCGVASFGAYLLSRNVLTMSVAPKDVHENQIQFALERGVPAMVAAFATRRFLYPSQAFDLIHCSRCRINWTRDDGILLLEVNRMLRAGGYFAWAAQPVYKHEEAQEEHWKEMLNLTTRLCWELVKKEGYVAIWQKPSNNSCYLSREAGTAPPLCGPDDNPDNVWYVDLKACISRLPENGYGANLPSWPDRLQTPPDRLQSIQLDAYIARKELFKAESKYWSEIISGHVSGLKWNKMKFRNVMDMRAGFGGFAAALIEQKLDAWVMNVVPVSGFNTLPVIYDRGLLGVMHDWCEPFDTYPRTYDLLHASGLFSVERKRCNMSTIMIEMDRMLRPGGHAYIRDSIDVMDELEEIANAMGWHVTMRETSEGPHASYRVLTGDKRLLHG
ncbi:probable methyltransferase PMT11 [Mangifera indica]|uniref:probable methyltransferase PMT11 n=1 Tax=Mangifera indica TaxID=29780 RepID=UPI001CFAE26D|nr:probable methyltransferase PMT11 [Mangifera indica]